MTKQKQVRKKTCWFYKLFKISACAYDFGDTEDSDICDDYKQQHNMVLKSMDEVKKILKDSTAEEIVSVLNHLDIETRRDIIIGLKMSVKPRKVSYGQVVKFFF